ncbi:MAG: ATP phosphoribosyltransferase [Patescibacteria group bacterium]
MEDESMSSCRLLVPDGSLQKVVHQLLAEAGIPISYPGERSYRGVIGNERLFPPPFNIATRMRPWDMPTIIADRKAELAFTGEDLIWEAGCEGKVIVLERYPLSRAGRGFTQLVVAVPNNSLIAKVSDLRPEHEVWTEYPNSAANWFASQGVNPTIRCCHGSLEALLEFADAIFENREWGETLKVGGWQTIAEVRKCQLCLITCSEALENFEQRKIIDEVRLLLGAVMAARRLCLIKCNVLAGRYDEVLSVMVMYSTGGTPTVSQLVGDKGFVLELVVESALVDGLLPLLKEAGAELIVQTPIDKFVR